MNTHRLATRTLAGIALIAGAWVATTSAASANESAFDNPSTTVATGVFELTTGPGIQPAWDAAGIALSSVAPASTTISTTAATTTISMPVVAKTGTANATAGGFRLTNTKTKESVRCFLPTVDTRARVIDCVLDAGYNSALFTIETIGTREFFGNTNFRTSVFTGMVIKVASPEFAKILNEALSTSVFTPSVTLATGDLTVTRRLP